MSVNLTIPTLGSKFKDYRDEIPGDSYDWGPAINANKVEFFTIHHSVTAQTAKNDGNWKAECNKIANLHLAQGWGGVGYRFIICSDGTVAYVGDLSHGGSAVEGKNDIMFSAVIVGDLTKELPTAYQVNSAHLLSKWFFFDMPQYPKLIDWTQLKGHKDFNPTACPGSAWPNDLRNRIITNSYGGYPNPQPIPPTDPCASQNAQIIKLTSELKTMNDLVGSLRDEINVLKGKINNAKKELA